QLATGGPSWIEPSRMLITNRTIAAGIGPPTAPHATVACLSPKRVARSGTFFLIAACLFERCQKKTRRFLKYKLGTLTSDKLNRHAVYRNSRECARDSRRE